MKRLISSRPNCNLSWWPIPRWAKANAGYLSARLIANKFLLLRCGGFCQQQRCAIPCARADKYPALKGTLRWSDGPEASLHCGFANLRHPVDLHLRAVGTRGEVLARNPVAPHIGGHLAIRIDGRRTYEWADRTPSYTYQLRAFVDAVRDGTFFPTTAADAVRNMAVIDALYTAAGVTPPMPTPLHGASV